MSHLKTQFQKNARKLTVVAASLLLIGLDTRTGLPEKALKALQVITAGRENNAQVTEWVNQYKAASGKGKAVTSKAPAVAKVARAAI